MTQAGSVYGEALYTLALEEGLSASILDELSVLAASFQAEPDFIRLLPNGKPIENVLLGLSPQTLSEAGDYRALLHNSVF